MGMQSGSDECWDFDKHANYIYRGKAESRSSKEREEYTKRGQELAYRMREKYGPDDPEVNYRIDKYGLDRD